MGYIYLAADEQGISGYPPAVVLLGATFCAATALDSGASSAEVFLFAMYYATSNSQRLLYGTTQDVSTHSSL